MGNNDQIHKHQEEESSSIYSSNQDNTATALDVSERQQEQQQLKEQIYSSPRQQKAETQKQELQTATKKKPNLTGIPDTIKQLIEQETGFSLDAVRVFYNSGKPEKYRAKAYTQGYAIYLAPGCEDELEHELRHMVQKMNGEVKTTTMVDGTPISEVPKQEEQAEKGTGTTSTSGDTLKEGKVTTKAIQRARKDNNELLALTVGAFDNHRKAEQMDWANTPDLTEGQRTVMWGIIEWGTGGLKNVTVKTITDSVAAKGANLGYIKNYCEAVQDGTIGGDPTTRVEVTDNIDIITQKGEWLVKLNAAIGGDRVRATIPDEALDLLIDDLVVFQAFIDYCNAQKPILQTAEGEEVNAFVELVGKEGAKIADYTGTLTKIRNYHKFSKVALDKLKKDFGKKNKPLTLVLVALFDHNGAFIRDGDVNDAITNDKTNAFAIEGTDVAAIKGLTADGLDNIAKDHGMGGKITQIMVAGHGDSKSMDMSGQDTNVYQDGDTKEYLANDEVAPTPIEFNTNEVEGGLSYDKFWTDFFAAAVSNMETKGGLDPVIMLNACLTASNDIDEKTLKGELVKAGLNLDGMGIDPTTTDNQDKIRKAIREQFESEGSLVTVLQKKVGGDATVLGAQASIDSDTTDLVDAATGKLEIQSVDDPEVAGPKINYVESGKEPVGVLKAVIESWAYDPVECFDKITTRAAKPANDEAEVIINLLYKMILNQDTYKKNILEANKLVSVASILYELTVGDTECRPSELAKNAIIQTNKVAFYGALLPKLTKDQAKLVVWHDWLLTDATKEKTFMQYLGDNFTRKSAEDYLNYVLIDGKLNDLFDADKDLKGRTILALIGFIKFKDVKCGTFLKTQVDGDQKLLANVKGALAGYNESTLRKNLGLPVEQVAAPGGVGRAKNVIIDGDDHYVSAMLTTTKKSKVVGDAPIEVAVYKKPDEGEAKLETFAANQDFEIVGELKRVDDDTSGNWYLVKAQNDTVGYMKMDVF